jgi:hypothetical protein
VEQATLSLARAGASDDRMLAVDIRRADIESALESSGGGSVELLLDIAARDLEGGGPADRHTLSVDCTSADLERLLDGHSDTVRVGFDAEALARAIQEPDTEAHGLREKMAVLAVVVATTGTVVGSAQAMPVQGGGGGGTTITDVRDMPADSMMASQSLGEHAGQMASPAIVSAAQATQPSGGTAIHDSAADTLAAAAATESGAPVHDMAADTLSASAAASQSGAPVHDMAADSLAASTGPAAAPVRDFPGEAARSAAAGETVVTARDFPAEAASGSPVLADSSKAPPVTNQSSGSISSDGIDATQFVAVGAIALALIGAAFAAAGVSRRAPKPS